MEQKLSTIQKRNNINESTERGMPVPVAHIITTLYTTA